MTDTSQELSANACDILSRVRVGISDTLKGEILPTQTIALTVPGGKVGFRNGTTAEVRMSGRYWPILGEKTYVLFLTLSPDGDGYWLRGSMQGVYRIDPDTGVIRPADMRGRRPLVRRFRGMKSGAFLREIRSIVAQQAGTQ